MPLTIHAIEAVALRAPLARTYRGSNYFMTHRSTILTRVYTEEGVVGEAYAGDEDATNAEIQQVIRDEVTPKLIGEDAFAVQRCWELTRPATENILRDRRVGLVATACVDVAIWDAIGKALGQPLWRLWGGYRDRLPVIRTGGYYHTDLDIPEEMTLAREAGMGGMKFKVGGLSPAEDSERFKRARKAAGDDFILVADANQGYTPDEAVQFARLVADDELFYFEEPCGWHNDRRAMRDVRYRSGARVCAGQSELTATGCLELMTSGAVDFCNFDSSWSGGPTEWLRVAAMAQALDVTMSHHEEAHIGAHLLAAIPNGTFADTFHPDRDPIWWELIANPPKIQDGIFHLHDRPGLGWELDGDFIEKCTVVFDN
ncbi:MAG: mandelate racemase/muconate lactonizing enzyme family protein [Streptosporangiales bacterium]|nr:mandelate racemase/muconate lactonizing enzyme family protein [Streptosporangiales bacterium]